ncbi:hypothetical protein ARMGADRAFT_1087877 [Armillaria gallica]|uniref:Uncharacterized protein n=1 Tax=Armillaria gallica TaxID=47427 RepID=A0A2H3D0K9_ARMGA|nr:hypothetical protein ARMGADRAFT_1087877 [Armillaria gallica]
MMNKPDRNIQAEPDPWSSWENARPDPDPDYLAITNWFDEHIPPLLCATIKLPNVPPERDPVPPYGDPLKPDPFTNLVPFQAQDNPFNPRGLNYKWPKLSDADRRIFGSHCSTTWELQRADAEAHFEWPHNDTPQVTMDFYLAIMNGDPFYRGHHTNTQIAVQIHTNCNRQLYPTSPGQRVMSIHP